MAHEQPTKVLLVAFTDDAAAAGSGINRLQPEARCFVLPDSAHRQGGWGGGCVGANTRVVPLDHCACRGAPKTPAGGGQPPPSAFGLYDQGITQKDIEALPKEDRQRLNVRYALKRDKKGRRLVEAEPFMVGGVYGEQLANVVYWLKRALAYVDNEQVTVEKDGGKLQKMEKWGKKRLAYAVRRHREGYYVLPVSYTHLTLPTSDLV